MSNHTIAVPITTWAEPDSARGEILALRWGDLDFNRDQMRIERARHYDESLPLAERYVIGQDKAGARAP